MKLATVSAVAAMLIALGCANPPPTPPPGAATPTPASPPTPGAFVRFAGGFSALTFVTNAGDGSGDLYAVEQVGRIVKATQGQSDPGVPWLDISDRIASGGERGLLGLAFHPDYKANGRFFVDYTNTDGNSVISEFVRSADGTVDPTNERVLLEVGQPYPNHNGGMLAFGLDGYLYIGLGDGGSAGDPKRNGQNLTTELGKILRIDVDEARPYSIPATNPFQPGNAQGAKPEIWDWGVRNPWRFSFDGQSGALFIGDVGQNQTEEIDVEPARLGGRNYGWNIMEGDHCYDAAQCNQTGLTPPVATYSHALGCSVVGGYVYRGARFASTMGGRYLYADYCSGTVWTIDAGAALAGQPVTPTVFGTTGVSVTSFGEDEAGELYIVDSTGSIWTLAGP